LITHITVHRQKRYKFFALAQSELGDVYKVTVEIQKEVVTGLSLAVLDTLPTANSLNVSKMGMLFVAAEFGDHGLDLPDAPTNHSKDLGGQELTTLNAVKVAKTFTPSLLQNLQKVCSLDNPSPTTGILVGELVGQRALWDSSRDDATPKLEVLCQYYVGEVVTSMTRSSLVAGGTDSLIYVTVTGRIGALVPFTSREDVDFFTQLEGYLRTDAPRPTGRDPQKAYRSNYAPVMHVVDGGLCDAFNTLSYEGQVKIAEQLNRIVGEIMKKLEDTRNSLL
jgi:hypothetical protein